MTRDEIVKLAQESGFRAGHITLTSGDPIAFIAPLSATSCIVELERFAAAEREACAQIVQSECIGFTPEDDQAQLHRCGYPCPQHSTPERRRLNRERKNQGRFESEIGLVTIP